MQEKNLNNIWNAGKYFEPQPEQPEKQPESEPKLSNVKRKKSVIGAFIDKPEDPFKEKVEAVLKGIDEKELASAPATADEEEKPILADTGVIVGTGQHHIGEGLVAGKSICVEGNAGNWTGYLIPGGEIRVKGNAGVGTGDSMSGGEIHVDGNAGDGTGKFMTGGKIHINGNSGRLAGKDMTGGEIHIKGDAGDKAGNCMSGGTLRIDGEVSSFDKTAFFPDNKGTIIWKEKTIWENGHFTAVGLNMSLNPFVKNKIKIKNK